MSQESQLTRGGNDSRTAHTYLEGKFAFMGLGLEFEFLGVRIPFESITHDRGLPVGKQTYPRDQQDCNHNSQQHLSLAIERCVAMQGRT